MTTSRTRLTAPGYTAEDPSLPPAGTQARWAAEMLAEARKQTQALETLRFCFLALWVALAVLVVALFAVGMVNL